MLKLRLPAASICLQEWFDVPCAVKSYAVPGVRPSSTGKLVPKELTAITDVTELWSIIYVLTGTDLENEYKNYKVKCEKIEKEKEKQKKKQSPEKLRKELDRLNFLFQKGRIEWDYYNEEYSRVESELNDLQNSLPEPAPNYSYLEELLNTDFRTMYDQLSQENRRAFWRSIIQEIHINEDSTITSVDFLWCVLY